MVTFLKNVTIDL